ncbi:MAG: 5-bromo-4-chloroindolyl phosphate hydrolysis family protein [Clostridia bacterium]|nr:5-bromo-4-chloroindolyl phosphate hydrolysis family protein [Clostridia bacterium]
MNNRPYKKLFIPRWLLLCSIFFPPLFVVLAVLSQVKLPYTLEDLKNIGKDFKNGDPFRTFRREGQGNGTIYATFTDKTDGEAAAGTEEPKKTSVKKKKITFVEVISIVIFALFALATLGGIIKAAQDPSPASFVALASFAGVSIAGFLANLFFRGRRKRYNRYLEWIGDSDSCSIQTLAYGLGEKERKVVKDLKRMALDGEFGPRAYVDERYMMFFRTPEAAEEYRKNKGYFGGIDKNPAGIDEYSDIILRIRQLNNEIADPEVSGKIDRIEQQTRIIFDYVKQHPEKKNTIRTFMNYYLPTTLKLLESYAKMEKIGEAGENVKASKDGIENILDTLVDGFVRQTDRLFAADSIDISSDIDVLETMMKKDGLTGERDFGPSSGAAAARKEDE